MGFNRSSRRSRQLAAALLLSALSVLAQAATASAQGVRAWVINDSNQLTYLDTARPNVLPRFGTWLPITGLAAGDTLVGVDFRPQNGACYALGYNSGAGTVTLYRLAVPLELPLTGGTVPAVVIGATGAFVAADGVTPAPIQGAAFGVDFEPSTDRIRVVNDAGQNFRIDPNTGLFVDGDLGGASGSVQGVNMDGALNGDATAVVAAAYTNNGQLASVSTLYTLRAAGHALAIQATANSGNQTASQGVTLNGSPLAFTGEAGFDIVPGIDAAANDAPVAGSGFAALTVGGVSSLYTIDLANGTATALGPIGDGTVAIRGFAVHRAEIAGGLPAIALGANTLIRFNTADTGVTRVVPVTGLVAGEVLKGLDWRPLNGQLIALGVNVANGTGSASLYRVDPQTGDATVIGSPSGVANGLGQPIGLNYSTTFGFDINPNTDLVRVVSGNGLNFRVNLNDGSVVGGTLDGPIVDIGVTAAAHTDSGAPTGNRFVQLLTLAPPSDRLYLQSPGGTGGSQTPLALVTIAGTPLDFEGTAGFDLPPNVLNGRLHVESTAYAFLTVGGVTRLYVLDLRIGWAAPIGEVAGVLPGGDGLAVGAGAVDPTAVTLSFSPNPAPAGQTVTLTATVAAWATPTGGIVRFKQVGIGDYFCVATPVVSGIATCEVDMPSGGSFAYLAQYIGDGYHEASTSPDSSVLVTGGVASSTTTLTIGPNPGRADSSVALLARVSPLAATGQVSFYADGTKLGAAPVVNGTAYLWKLLDAGTYQITATYEGDATYATSTATTPLTVNPVTMHTRYFAEGATSAFLHTDLGVFNPAPNAANIQVTVFPENGAAIPLPAFTLAARSRRSIDLNAEVGSLGGISLLVESTQPVAATRTMTWGDPVYGSTLEHGTPGPSTAWYFAEGATSAFNLYFLVQNPNADPATVTLTFLQEGGAAPIVETRVVPGFSRHTVDVNAIPGLETAAMSTVITSDRPVVAERSMFLNTTGRLWEGATTSLGASVLSPSWLFAEGATGFFHTYLLLGNPNPGTAQVKVTYAVHNNLMVEKTYHVAGGSRLTVDIAGEDPRLASATFGTSVESNIPIMAERAMWWGEPWTDGSASLGSGSSNVWAIAEGAEGGPDDEATFLLLSNPSQFYASAVDITVVYDDGTTEEAGKLIGQNGRLSVRVGDIFPNSKGRRFSLLIEKSPDGHIPWAPAMVDVARYRSGTMVFDAGGAAPATPIVLPQP